MRLGLVGAAGDPQLGAVAKAIRALGLQPVVVDPEALGRGSAITFDGARTSFSGDALADVGAVHVRGTVSPMPPTFVADEDYVLFEDWFEEYMARRERMGLLLSWLVGLGYAGIPVVNAPEHGAAIQLKAFQLQAAGARGFTLPRTCITNDPAAVRAFQRDVKDVVFKPSMGGGLTQPLDREALGRLDLITRAPVAFQERIHGTNIRVTVVGDNIISVVSIPSEALDYRADPQYQAGKAVYGHVSMEPAMTDAIRSLMTDVGLVHAGLDFIRSKDGTWYFLEANPAPVWLDIERRTDAPISRALAEHLLSAARHKDIHQARMQQARRPSSFCRYALPMEPRRNTRSRSSAKG